MLFNREGQEVALAHNASDYERAQIIEQKIPRYHHQGKMFRVEERARIKEKQK